MEIFRNKLTSLNKIKRLEGKNCDHIIFKLWKFLCKISTLQLGKSGNNCQRYSREGHQ